MDRHIWLTINDCDSSRDEFNNFYPDVMTFPINKFIYTEIPLKHKLTQQEIIRFDLFVYNIYGVTYYDDIILWLNNIEFKEDLIPEQNILLPIKEDLDKFFVTYII